MKRVMLILFIGICLVATLSAAEESLESLGSGIKVDDCVELIQICGNCTYNNISAILSPNKTVLASNLEMTKDDTRYNYTFCGNSVVGKYIVNGYGDLNGIKQTWVYDYEVSPSGFILSEGTAILYAFLMIVIIVLLFISIYFGITLPSGNIRNNDEEIIQINWKKYSKMFAWGMAYLWLTVLIFIMWNLSWGFLEWNTIGIIFHYWFRILLIGATVFVPGLFVWVVVRYINDKKIQTFIEKMGIPYMDKYSK